MSRVLSFLVFYFSLSWPLSTVAQDLSRWKNIASFRPSESIQKAIQARGESWTVHRIEDGVGPINLDFYPIKVDKMPTISGKDFTAEQLLEYVRTHLNEFVATEIASFSPFDEADKRKWNSNLPLGSLLIVDIEMMLGIKDYSPLVTSSATKNEWRFSTVRGGSGWYGGRSRDQPSAHPVAGNRAFGFVRKQSGSWTFYTIGADRANRLIDAAATSKIIGEYGFKQADKVWRTFQKRLADYVNENGGKASVNVSATISERHSWESFSKNKSAYDPSREPSWVPVPLSQRD